MVAMSTPWINHVPAVAKYRSFGLLTIIQNFLTAYYRIRIIHHQSPILIFTAPTLQL